MEKTEYLIPAVCHALDLLEQYHDDSVFELGVTELSNRLQLHKNNVFRLLATLTSRQYIEQNKATENYHLGLKSLALGQNFQKHSGMLRQARPVLERLVGSCRETAYVSALKGTSVVYLDMCETDHPVRVVPRLGAWLPAYCTAAGKVHLAGMNEEYLGYHLPKVLQSYTPNTITTRKVLKDQLKKIADQGHAVDDEELNLEVRCVGAPVRDYNGVVIGAISLSGPTVRFSRERMRELIALVRAGGEEISARLGYSKERY